MPCSIAARKARASSPATAGNSASTSAWDWCRRFLTATTCTRSSATWPSSIGRVGDGWALASETVAFDQVHARFVRDVEPGEIVILNADGLQSIQAFPEQTRRAFCMFEYVYFARPDSAIAGRSVYEVRK